MADHIKREMRYFRNHYLCDDCPNEWSEEMAVVAADHCPCCDRRSEPYDSEALLEQIKASPDEAIETLVEMLQDAGILSAEGIGPSLYTREAMHRIKGRL